MTHVTYKIVEHDGGWAYTVNGVFSEPFPNRAAALAAAQARGGGAAGAGPHRDDRIRDPGRPVAFGDRRRQ